MNKEQLLEKVRRGKLAIENDPTFKKNTLQELRKCLNILFPKDITKIIGTGIYYYAQTPINTEWDDSRKTDLPTIKVSEALQILKEPNMEDKLEQLEKRLSLLEERFSEPKTAREPECPYKEGELIFVRNNSDWLLLPSTGIFINGKVETYYNQDYSKSKSKTTWEYHASTNGLKLPE